jgi:hypothetical protein
MTLDPETPSLSEVAKALDGLMTPNASDRRQLMDRLERWAKVGFPGGAGRLILEHAARSFPSSNQYPETPNEQLIRLLWNRKTTVSGDDVESVFPDLDEACRVSAIRLMAELGTRTASESLGRLLSQCTESRLPNAMWPFLLPLERNPRDPDVLVPPLLGLLADTDGAGAVHAALLAYAKADLLNPAQSRVCGQIASGQTSRALDTVGRILTERGLAGRWDDDYVSAKIDAGLLLDLLGRLDRSSSMSVLEDAVRAPEPWIKLWGALGLLRGGESVSPEIFRQVAEWPDCRIALARELQAEDRAELFPVDFLNQPSLAEAAMVDWLRFPTELGRAPDEIRQLQSLPVETDEGIADLYVFAFRTHPPHWLSEKDWVVGLAGPFLQSQQPTVESLGGTFSRFESLSARPLDQHIETLLETVQGIPGPQG